ncbi:hypothetical protein FOZ60_015515 [Perkinsus olseni]|uniref:Uncharacterized protein n=1 Tax=Perkinsus olseni TaxID=32597 RepID=A0A7J6RZ62_PEROL|nr:hypothetical protein FOZ60_015515 [Perkinsus olseni]KAF4725793.1 hypothetical protein FOZ62_000786 [Perkinsus olseni]
MTLGRAVFAPHAALLRVCVHPIARLPLSPLHKCRTTRAFLAGTYWGLEEADTAPDRQDRYWPSDVGGPREVIRDHSQLTHAMDVFQVLGSEEAPFEDPSTGAGCGYTVFILT